MPIFLRGAYTHLPELKNCQNGFFEPLHEIPKFLKYFFWTTMKMPFTKNIPNMSQGPPNSGFRSVRVKNREFLKKESQDFKNDFQHGFL